MVPDMNRDSVAYWLITLYTCGHLNERLLKLNLERAAEQKPAAKTRKAQRQKVEGELIWVWRGRCGTQAPIKWERLVAG
jgi:hypothetical protein